MTDLGTLMADTDFQNRFGMHTKPFQELAANAILFATKVAREGKPAYAHESSEEQDFSSVTVQAAVIAAQAEEIKSLKQEGVRLSYRLSAYRDALMAANHLLDRLREMSRKES